MGQSPTISPGARVPSRSQQALAFGGLFIFTFLLYGRPQELLPDIFGTFPIVKVVAIVSLVAYVISKLGRGEPLTVWPIELKALAVIVLLGVCLIPLAASPEDSINTLLDPFLKVVTTFVLIINLIDSRKRLRLILNTVVVCGTAFSIFAVVSYATGALTIKDKGVGVRIAGIVGGMFGNPNDLATTLDMLLPLAVVLALNARGIKRLFFFCCAGALICGITVSFSRGGFLGLVAMGGVLLWKLGRRNRLLSGIVLAVVLAGFVAIVPTGYSNRLSTIFNIEEDPTGSAEARRELLSRGIEIASSHVLVGVGLGNYHQYSYFEQVAHNSYLEIAAELGLIGLAAYMVMLIVPLVNLRRIERATREEDARSAARGDPALRAEPRKASPAREIYLLTIGIQASIVAYIVCSLFSSIQYFWYMYYAIGYAVALKTIYESEQAVSLSPINIFRRPVPALSSEGGLKGVLWNPQIGGE